MKKFLFALAIFLVILSCNSEEKSTSTHSKLEGFWKFKELRDDAQIIDKGDWSIRSIALDPGNKFILITEKEVIKGDWHHAVLKNSELLELKNASSSDGPKSGDQKIPIKMVSDDELVLIFAREDTNLYAHYIRTKAD